MLMVLKNIELFKKYSPLILKLQVTFTIKAIEF